MTYTPPPQPGEPDQPSQPQPPGPPQQPQWPAPPGMPPQGPPPGGMAPQGPLPPGMPPQGPLPPGMAPPAKSRRGLVIGLVIGAVVAVLLCAGCLTAGVVYYVTNGSSSSASDSGDPLGGGATPEATQSSAAPGACRAEPLSGGSEIKAVGMPDFANAPRSGTATMRITTNLGAITITMDRAATPCTVASFEHLAAKHYFDGTSCHRLVTEGLSILQCGDPTGTGMGRPDYQFVDENLAGARYTRGVVAMANAGPGTNGSQFFIVFRDGELDPAYTPFGTVTAGLEVVDKVAAGGHDNSISAGGGTPKTTLTFQGLTVD